MQRNTEQLKDQTFDLLVCGGGIYGAWTAYDASLRGLSVAIIDKGDWACGTSSASSKLIHGGLRYLENFDFKLVRKTLAERDMLLQAAPHRVWPLRFGIPVYNDSKIGKFRLKAGLMLYDCLAGELPAIQKHRSFSKDSFIQRFPALNPSGLLTGFSYFDAQTDDARFVVELIDGANTLGATCVNYCELTGLIEQNGKIIGAKVTDKITDETVEIKTSIVVDTSGRWSSHLVHANQAYRLAKGIHLIMPGILKDEALLLTAKSDGRVFFMIPWYGLTLLGTTDTNYDGDLEKPPISPEDVRYLLDEANQVLTSAWTGQDIIGKFAGLRVLQQSQLDNPSSISRDWLLQTSPNGLLSSIGGKFTSARQDAAEIVDTVCERLGINRPCNTFGKAFPWISGSDFELLKADSMFKAKKLGIDEESAHWLVKRHGKNIREIFQLCQENRDLTQRIVPELPLIMADLNFCAINEMTEHLDDLIRRRLPLTILSKLSHQDLSYLAEIAANLLGWDNKKITAEIKRCLD